MKGYSRLITNYYSIKKYNDDNYKLVIHKCPVRNTGFELDPDFIVSRDRDINENKLDNHLSRAKGVIFDYSMANDFDYFVTLTLDRLKYDRYDLKRYIKDLGQFIRNYRRDYGVNIQYLLIPEQHQDGAWHMHGLINGIPEEHLTLNSNGYKDWKSYSNRFGYMSIDNVRSQEAVSKYITKYIKKSIDLGAGVTEKNKKLYYASRGLKKPIKVKEGTFPHSEINVTFDYENDYIGSVMLNGLTYLKLNNILDTL